MRTWAPDRTHDPLPQEYAATERLQWQLAQSLHQVALGQEAAGSLPSSSREAHHRHHKNNNNNNNSGTDDDWFYRLQSRIVERGIAAGTREPQDMMFYEDFICTRRRTQLLAAVSSAGGESIGRESSMVKIFEAHGAARCAIHRYAFTIQQWWRRMSRGVDRKNVVEQVEPFAWERVRRRKERELERAAAESETADGLPLMPTTGAGNAPPPRRRLTYAESYAMRDPRTKPTGRYKRLSGGKFSEARPWGYIDWALKSASGKPGPAKYSASTLKPRDVGGGQFSEARPWGYIDWALKSASGKPGPAAYSPKLLPRLRGAARFSNVTPKSYIDWAVYFAKDVPGPADYDIELCR